jgi:hypothetical protein
LVPADDAAQEFGLGRSTLNRLVRTLGLKRFKKPGDRRTWLDRDQLREAIRFHEKPPPD